MKVSPKAAVKVLVRQKVVSHEGLTEEGSIVKFTYMVVAKIQFFTGCWAEGFSSLLAVG